MVMRQVFAAEFIECGLRLVLAERDEVPHQFRVGARIGLVDQFVVSRDSVDAHLMHGGGDAQGKVVGHGFLVGHLRSGRVWNAMASMSNFQLL